MRKFYNWRALFERRRFRLLEGRDYACSTASIIQQARNAAGILSGKGRRARQGRHQIIVARSDVIAVRGRPRANR